MPGQIYAGVRALFAHRQNFQTIIMKRSIFSWCAGSDRIRAVKRGEHTYECLFIISLFDK